MWFETSTYNRDIGKDSTSALSLVIHRVRLKKILQKNTLTFNWGWNPLLSFVFPKPLHCCYIDFHCSYLYSYYNSSRTFCIKCWDSTFRTEFSISYWDFIKFHYLADTTKRGARSWKEAQRRGEDRVTLPISLITVICLSCVFLNSTTPKNAFLSHHQLCFVAPRMTPDISIFIG